MLYHRAPAFVEVYARALERPQGGLRTENEVLVFASSGTGALESAVANLTRPGEPALVASCGKFGERWAKLCDAYGADTVHLGGRVGHRRSIPPSSTACWARTPASRSSSPPSPRPRPASSTTSAS